jgi:hypothetical protein
MRLGLATQPSEPSFINWFQNVSLVQQGSFVLWFHFHIFIRIHVCCCLHIDSDRPYLIKTNGGVLAGRSDADIGTAEKLVGGEDGANAAGNSNNDKDGVGGGITQPFLLEGLLWQSMRVLGAHEAASTVVKKQREKIG